jgi:hypothetical protein
MASLASTDDLQARLGIELDDDRAQAILDDVSAVVRAYTGQQFTQAETTDRLQARNGGVTLPQRPVTAVDTVDDVDGNTVAFDWDSGSFVALAGLAGSRSFEVEPFVTRQPWVDVTYTHGYETVPADVVAVVCQMAGRTYGRTADTSGVTQESIAGYSYSVGAAAAAGPMGMLADERRILDLYRKPIGTIRVSA